MNEYELAQRQGLGMDSTDQDSFQTGFIGSPVDKMEG